MSTMTLDQAIDTVNQLSLEQQEMLADILQNRLREIRRQQMADAAADTLAAFRQGTYKPQSAADIIADLESSVDDGTE